MVSVKESFWPSNCDDGSATGIPSYALSWFILKPDDYILTTFNIYDNSFMFSMFLFATVNRLLQEIVTKSVFPEFSFDCFKMLVFFDSWQR